MKLALDLAQSECQVHIQFIPLTFSYVYSIYCLLSYYCTLQESLPVTRFILFLSCVFLVLQTAIKVLKVFVVNA